MSETAQVPGVLETESQIQKPADPVVLDAVQSDEAILNYTQQIRMGIVSQLTARGSIPDDKADKTLLTQTLDGLDRQALGKMKLDVEKDVSNQLATATVAINELLNTVKTDVFTSATPVVRVLPEIPMETIIVVEETLVVGELETGYKEETVDEFKSRYDAEHGVDGD